MKLYDNPEVYEIPFTFRKIAQEVNFFEKAIAKLSRVPVHTVLELASGTAPYLDEWHRRGYRYIGIDNSREMVRFARKKAGAIAADATLLQTDMNTFDLGSRKVDLAYVLLGSIYVSSNEVFLGHLNRVARVLRRGGLYILDGVVNFKLLNDRKETWTTRHKQVSARTTYELEVLDPLKQLCRERLTVRIAERGRRRTFRSIMLRKLFFPQELLLLLQDHGKFEFVGWYKNFRLSRPGSGKKGRHIVILRKR